MGPPADDDEAPTRSDDGAGEGRHRDANTSNEPDGGSPPEPNAPRSANPTPPRSGAATHHDRSGETAMDAVASLAKDLVVTALIVGLLISLLFGISGVWPPLVAVESDSMEPQIMTGDLVFIMDTHRFAGDGAIDGTGVVPADRGEALGYDSFGRSGDVIIFAPDGDGTTTPIIHRAHLWVDEGENWAARADEQLVSGSPNCNAMDYCPAPHAGFITHGDNNRFYDQEMDQSAPVRPDWIIAKAELRVPWLGNIRLLVSFLAPSGAAGALVGLGMLRRSNG